MSDHSSLIDPHKIYVAGLAEATTKKGLVEWGSLFGEVRKAHINHGRNTYNQRYGFILFDDKKAVEKAHKEYNNHPLDGSHLLVRDAFYPASARRPFRRYFDDPDEHVEKVSSASSSPGRERSRSLSPSPPPRVTTKRVRSPSPPRRSALASSSSSSYVLRDRVREEDKERDRQRSLDYASLAYFPSRYIPENRHRLDYGYAERRVLDPFAPSVQPPRPFADPSLRRARYNTIRQLTLQLNEDDFDSIDIPTGSLLRLLRDHFAATPENGRF